MTLPLEIARPLVEAAKRLRHLEPWTLLSDQDLIGVHDETTGELRVGTVLGARKEVFAVVMYREIEGIRWIHRMATTDELPDPVSSIEGMDFLKAEWTSKRELRAHDIAVLKSTGYEPAGKGRVWPLFQSCQPGWHPWHVSDREACQLTEDLAKLARWVEMARRRPEVLEDRLPSQVPIVPAGNGPLTPEHVQWIPLVPCLAVVPESLSLPKTTLDQWTALPQEKSFIVELLFSLAPELSFLDDTEGRPCFARLGLLIHKKSSFILASEVANAAVPIHELAERILTKGLHSAQKRPGTLRVCDARLAGVLRPACEPLGIALQVVPELPAAARVLASLIEQYKT